MSQSGIDRVERVLSSSETGVVWGKRKGREVEEEGKSEHDDDLLDFFDRSRKRVKDEEWDEM